MTAPDQTPVCPWCSHRHDLNSDQPCDLHGCPCGTILQDNRPPMTDSDTPTPDPGAFKVPSAETGWPDSARTPEAVADRDTLAEQLGADVAIPVGSLAEAAALHAARTVPVEGRPGEWKTYDTTWRWVREGRQSRWVLLIKRPADAKEWPISTLNDAWLEHLPPLTEPAPPPVPAEPWSCASCGATNGACAGKISQGEGGCCSGCDHRSTRPSPSGLTISTGWPAPPAPTGERPAEPTIERVPLAESLGRVHAKTNQPVVGVDLEEETYRCFMGRPRFVELDGLVDVLRAEAHVQSAHPVRPDGLDVRTLPEWEVLAGASIMESEAQGSSHHSAAMAMVCHAVDALYAAAEPDPVAPPAPSPSPPEAPGEPS